MQADILELAENQAEICGVFGNAHRVLILWALGSGERSGRAIASTVSCSLQNASQHLRLMKDRGILASRRDGNTIYYRINRNDLMHHCRLLRIAQQKPLKAETKD
jgi:DNA-binding transcriptional ArsR family regulator